MNPNVYIVALLAFLLSSCVAESNPTNPANLICGDGVCHQGETETSCAQDCKAVALMCGDGICHQGENASSCPRDCAPVMGMCGDDICHQNEDAMSCPGDCAVQVPCGDGVCSSSETMVSCPTDCKPVVTRCGDMFCQGDEDEMSCPTDCSAMASFCGDGTCDPNESTENCTQDCGTCRLGCDGDDVLFCGENNTQERFTCPVELGSTCVGDGEQTRCSCGQLSQGSAECLMDMSAISLVECTQGDALALYVCSQGAYCDSMGGMTGCYCDNASDGICPDPGCADDPDCNVCTPSCDGLTCGDNGCGGSCGSCGVGETCMSGSCASACAPNCVAKSCGSDGCGGSCGTCSNGQVCSTQGVCETPAPVVDSVSFDVVSPNGQSRTVSFTEPNGFFHCDIDTTTNQLSLEFANKPQIDTIRIYIEKDPIGFCFFATSSFTTFSYVQGDSNNFQAYGKDSLGQTMDLLMSCSVMGPGNQRLSGTFSSGRLFRGRNSSASPQDFVSIKNGTFNCTL